MLKQIRYIAIDDSLVDLMMLKEYAADFPFLKFEGSYTDPAEGIKAVEEKRPDLVFLDVEMPGLTGIEVLQQIKNKVQIAIFVTSHPEFALEGFELSALDYVLKPITEERFSTTAKRIEDYWQMKQQSEAYAVIYENELLTIKDGHHQVKLPLHEIIYLEAMQDYTKIVTQQKSYLTLTTLTGFLDKLPMSKFLRIHRSYAVALAKITALQLNKVICNEMEIPVGKTYKAAVNAIRI